MRITIPIEDMESSVEVEVRPNGILLDTNDSSSIAFLTPAEARKIASALNEAADEQEKRNG